MTTGADDAARPGAVFNDEEDAGQSTSSHGSICLACRGRGVKTVTSRYGLVARALGVLGRSPVREVKCRACGGSGREGER